MGSKNPAVSVVMPNFNKAAFIEEAVKSVLIQTNPNWELLIVDDCSSDNSAGLITQLAAGEERIRTFLQKQNTGGNACRNLGLREARAPLVMFLDSDDLLHPECLEQRIEFAEKHPGMHFWVFTLEVFKEKPGDSHHRWTPVKANALDLFLRHKLPWQTMQPLYHCDFLRAQGGFDEDFQRLQDVELHTRLLFLKDIRFEVRQHYPDCFFRVSDERHVFHAFNFYCKRAEAVTAYIKKFLPAASAIGKSKFLYGTWLKLMNEISFVFRSKKISKEEFQQLKQNLQPALQQLAPGVIKRQVIRIGMANNASSFRIKGLNFAIEWLLLRT
jgi:glycosyltransferase involved in cell wall biosynthesis